MLDTVAVAAVLACVFAVAVAIWFVECRGRIVLTSYVLFSLFFFAAVVPGFLWGMHLYGQDMLWAAAIVGVAFLSFAASFVVVLAATGADTAVGKVAAGKRRLRWTTAAAILTAVNLLLIAGGVALYRGIPPGLSNAATALAGGLDETTVNSLSEARRGLTKGHLFGGQYAGQGAIRGFLFNGYLFLVPLAWLYWRVRRNVFSVLLFLVTFLLAFVNLSGDGTRAPFLFMIVSIVVAESLLVPVTLKKLAVSGLALIVLAMGVSAYSPKMYRLISEGGVGAAVWSVVERITIGNSINDAFAVQLVDDGRLRPGYGYWFARDIIAAVPGAGGAPPLAYELYLQSDNPPGNTTYLTGTLISRGYADGGLAGILISFAMMGAACALSDRLLAWNASSIVHKAFLAALFVAVSGGYLSGVVGTTVKVALLCVATLPFVLFGLWRERVESRTALRRDSRRAAAASTVLRPTPAGP